MAYKTAQHTFVKDGIFYFVRRVPLELRRHYSSPKISYSLRTRSKFVASSRAIRAADRLDEYWFHLRMQDAELPGRHLLRQQRHTANTFAPQHSLDDDIDSPKLSDAVTTYLRLKGAGKGKTFHRAAERSCGYVLDTCGDKQLTAYTKADANTFRDALIKRGMAGSSITRVFGTVRSVVNFAASEEGITINNPFGGVYYDRSAGVEDRLPVSTTDLRTIQAECRKIDDEMRWLVALVADTGMRLAEAAGLLLDDIMDDDDGIPFIRVSPHPWRRICGRARYLQSGHSLHSGISPKGPLCAVSIRKKGVLIFLHVCPSNKPACFLPLCHFDNFKISDPGFSQNSVERLQVILFRHQRGEPQALIGEFHALFNHAGDKPYFATRTPKFSVLTAKVELL